VVCIKASFDLAELTKSKIATNIIVGRINPLIKNTIVNLYCLMTRLSLLLRLNFPDITYTRFRLNVIKIRIYFDELFSYLAHVSCDSRGGV